MKLYHVTLAGEAILREGFRDGKGRYMTDREHVGVWFSDSPLYDHIGIRRAYTLAIEMPEDEISDLEWPQEGLGYREWLIPAEVANRNGPPEVESRPSA